MSEEKPSEIVSQELEIMPKLEAASKKSVPKPPVPHKHKVYKIVWRDAFSEMDEWHDTSTVDREDYLCETIGYLIADNGKKQYYTMASTITADGFFCCVINIPKAMVISKQRINITI
jgi:hypothetical protein